MIVDGTEDEVTGSGSRGESTFNIGQTIETVLAAERAILGIFVLVAIGSSLSNCHLIQ